MTTDELTAPTDLHLPPLPASWRQALSAEIEKPYYRELDAFVAAERAAHQVFPPREEVFAALEATAYEDVRVVLLGQDPYHDDGQAHGLCFSVRPGVRVPPSLRNMYKELNADLGLPIPANGDLRPWTKQGVLLLNTVLTVRAHEANSHKKRGWETFTDAVIRAVSAREQPVVFVLWGGPAKTKTALIDTGKHRVIEGVHPSPLSANKGFHGSRPYSAVNEALGELGYSPVDWTL
ncbi:uracil-DNA glycosylase [Actinospica robiniae]|uniref:uracil-DNA glycosylase n=1 Tax=Actinospica robiniae TaxID=304901 RepID=UPI001FDF76BE|nr:uracil-DNA glycosylase [Actinospica robiniae]